LSDIKKSLENYYKKFYHYSVTLTE